MQRAFLFGHNGDEVGIHTVSVLECVGSDIAFHLDKLLHESHFLAGEVAFHHCDVVVDDTSDGG